MGRGEGSIPWAFIYARLLSSLQYRIYGRSGDGEEYRLGGQQIRYVSLEVGPTLYISHTDRGEGVGLEATLFNSKLLRIT